MACGICSGSSLRFLQLLSTAESSTFPLKLGCDVDDVDGVDGADGADNRGNLVDVMRQNIERLLADRGETSTDELSDKPPNPTEPTGPRWAVGAQATALVTGTADHRPPPIVSSCGVRAEFSSSSSGVWQESC